jgi:DNA mismatch repair protein MutL
MAYPEVSFSFTHNGKAIFQLPSQGLKPRIVGVLGKQWSEYLIPVEESTDKISIKGFVGKPEKSRKRPGEQYFFVNRRFFKSGYFYHALNSAFEGLIPKDHKPVYAIYFEMDPAQIDVNVHPTKQEVKFEDQRALYNYLRVAVRHALGKFQVTPSLDFEADNRFFQSSNTQKSGGSPSQWGGGQASPSGSDDWASFLSGLRSSEKSGGSDDELILGSKIKPEEGEEERLFSGPTTSAPYQIHQSYLISPIRSGFLIIDQSLAHERILYEKYLSILEQKQVHTQTQLYPNTVEFSAADAELFEEMLPTLQSLGFDIQPFGNNTFILQGMPSLGLLNSDGEQILLQLLDDYKNDRDSQLSIDKNVAQMLARTSSIKKGKELEPDEIDHLIAQLFACNEPAFSPGGRPCFITYSLKDLQKKFSKKQ